MTKISRIFSAIMILLGVYVIVVANSFPKETSGLIGPGVFPMFIGALLIALSVLQLYLTTRTKEESKTDSPKNTGRVAIIVGIVIVYLVGVKIIGFLISTPIFIFGVMWFLSVRSWVSLILTSFATTFILYLVFLKFLSVSLPSGILF